MAGFDMRVPKVGDKAPDLVVLNDKREPVRLSELWAKGPLVLLFYRGDFSQPCRDLLREYRDSALAFRQQGARIAALSADEPAVSAFLRIDRGLPFDLLCDPDGKAIDAWGLLDRGDHGGTARPATFVVDRAGIVRTRALADEKHVPAEAIHTFVRRGGAQGGRPARLRVARALRKVAEKAAAFRDGLRALRPQRIA